MVLFFPENNDNIYKMVLRFLWNMFTQSVKENLALQNGL